MQQIPVALLSAGATRPGLALEAGISQGDRQEALEPTHLPSPNPARAPEEKYLANHLPHRNCSMSPKAFKNRPAQPRTTGLVPNLALLTNFSPKLNDLPGERGTGTKWLSQAPSCPGSTIAGLEQESERDAGEKNPSAHLSLSLEGSQGT